MSKISFKLPTRGEEPGEAEIPAAREPRLVLGEQAEGRIAASSAKKPWSRKTLLLSSASAFSMIAILVALFTGGTAVAPVREKAVQEKKLVPEIRAVAEKKVVPISQKPAAAKTAAPVCGSVSDPRSAGEMLKRCIEAYNAAS